MALIIDPNGNPAAPDAAGTAGGTATGPADADLIKDSDTARFMTDVIEASRDVPVIVDFWAPWCGPCKQLGPLIERLVRQAGGLVKLVKINVDENQDLAAQLRVQSIPAVYGFHQGQPVDAFVGAQPESQIKSFIDRLTGGAKRPLDAALDQAKEMLDAGDAAGAGSLYNQILGQDPENGAALGGLIRALMATGEGAAARKFVDGLDAKLKRHADVAAAISALDLAEQTEKATDPGETAELRQRLVADENDHQARYDLALALYGAGGAEEALAELLEVVRRDRAWNDDAARKQILKIFDALGPTDPVTLAARRRLSSILFS